MSLSQEEKEQVAVLLGWTPCQADHIPSEPHWFNDSAPTRACRLWQMVVTLESCMEYAKGKGFSWMLSSHVENTDAYVSLWPASHRLDSVDTWNPDPLTAFVRALLKAEEASR